jgi:hypothetical protein
MLQVWFDHNIVGEFDLNSTQELNESGRDLTIITPDGTRHLFKHGEWHAAGVGVQCASATPRDDCVNCHPWLKKEGT